VGYWIGRAIYMNRPRGDTTGLEFLEEIG
jgi:hypothetical protein